MNNNEPFCQGCDACETLSWFLRRNINVVRNKILASNGFTVFNLHGFVPCLRCGIYKRDHFSKFISFTSFDVCLEFISVMFYYDKNTFHLLVVVSDNISIELSLKIWYISFCPFFIPQTKIRSINFIWFVF